MVGVGNPQCGGGCWCGGVADDHDTAVWWRGGEVVFESAGKEEAGGCATEVSCGIEAVRWRCYEVDCVVVRFGCCGVRVFGDHGV